MTSSRPSSIDSVPLSVCLKTSTAIQGGLWRHVLELAEGLRQRGVRVRVDVPFALRQEVVERGFDVTSGGQEEVLHLHLGNTHELGVTATLVLARLRGRAVVITEHLPHLDASDPALAFRPPRPGASLAKVLLKRLHYTLATKVIVLSTGSAEFVTRRYRPRPGLVQLVPNGVAVSEVLNEVVSRSTPRLVATGSLIAQKGFDLLVEAATLARRDWVVDVFGRGPHLEELQARSSTLLTMNGRPRIQFLGWSDQVVREIRDADAVVMPSRWEAMPYSALEAMALGRPVIGTRVDGLSDLVVHGRTGLLVDPEASALSAALDAFSELAEADRAAMGRRASERVREHFTLDRMVEKTEAVYLSLEGPWFRLR